MLCRSLAVAFACFAYFAAPQSAQAQSQDYDVRPDAAQVTGDALTSAFEGQTHDGAYNFDQRGRPGARFIERHYADGRVVYTEDKERITGRWTVTPGHTICYSYDSDDINDGCFRVYQLGSCYYFYSSYFIARENEIDQDYWTARTVQKGKRATCEDMIS